MDLHQTQLKGFTPEQAENYFLRIASQLDTYAVDPHPVKVIFIIFARSLKQPVNIISKDFQFRNVFFDSLSFQFICLLISTISQKEPRNLVFKLLSKKDPKMGRMLTQ